VGRDSVEIDDLQALLVVRTVAHELELGCQHFLRDPGPVCADHGLDLFTAPHHQRDPVADCEPRLLSHTLYPANQLASHALTPELRRHRYVEGREVLLDGVVESMVATMEFDSEVLHEPVNGWQDFLLRLAHGIRRVALAYPKSFPLVASRPTEAPWLRPPLRSLRWVELFLAGLTKEGFSDTAAVQAYRAFTSFLLGHLLLEVAMLGADLGPLDVLEEDDDVSLRAFPNTNRMRQPLREDHSATEFEEALEELINRLALIRSEG